MNRVAALAVALALGALFVSAAGGNPIVAGEALLAGAFGDRFALAETVTRAVPLLLAGLAVALAFRAGVLNIGAEGQILGGAAACVAVGLRLDGAPAVVALPAVLAAAALGGGAVGAIAAALRRWRAVPEVLSTILLNFVMLQVVSWLVRGPLQETSGHYPQSDPIAESARLARLVPPTRLHAGAIVALGAVALAWLFLFRTAAGLRWRATGLSPEAARFAGFRPARVAFAAMVGSAALAGVAGGVEVTGLTGRLYGDLSAGVGYAAIGVALLGRLHPWGIVAAALFFGALEAGSAEMQRSADVSAALAQVIEATALCAVFAVEFLSRRRRAALGAA